MEGGRSGVLEEKQGLVGKGPGHIGGDLVAWVGRRTRKGASGGAADTARLPGQLIPQLQ